MTTLDRRKLFNCSFRTRVWSNELAKSTQIWIYGHLFSGLKKFKVEKSDNEGQISKEKNNQNTWRQIYLTPQNDFEKELLIRYSKMAISKRTNGNPGLQM